LRDIPDDSLVIIATGGQPPAVRAKTNIENFCIVTVKDRSLPATIGLPDRWCRSVFLLWWKGD